MRKPFVFLMTLLLSGAASFAAKGKIQMEVTPKDIYIGDPVQVRITVTISSDTTPAVFEPPKQMGDFELLNFSSMVLKQDVPTIRHDLTLTTFSTGAVNIPAISLLFLGPDQKPIEAKTEEMAINVKSLLQEKGDLGGLRPPKGLFDFRSYFWIWMVLLAVMLVLAAVAYNRWRKSKQTGAAIETGPPRPPEETAWDALHELEDTDLLVQGQVREYYYRLSTILRRYLEQRYKVPALDRTTSELLQEFRALKMPLDVVSVARELFDNADLVKFAKFTPSETDIAQDLDNAKRLINLTTPAPAAPKKKEAIPA